MDYLFGIEYQSQKNRGYPARSDRQEGSGVIYKVGAFIGIREAGRQAQTVNAETPGTGINRQLLISI
jgi:hypothetical protein